MNHISERERRIVIAPMALAYWAAIICGSYWTPGDEANGVVE